MAPHRSLPGGAVAAAWLASAAVWLAFAAPAGARTVAPDLPGHTSQSAGPAATGSAISAATLRKRLARLMRRAGSRSGAWVAGSDGRTLFRRAAKRRRRLASNMKLFTTSTALVRLGAERVLPTSVWATGAIASGVVRGDLILRGGGDPVLGLRRLAKLAAGVRAAGIRGVTGRLLFDDSIFDRRRSVPQTGISGDYLGGVLSGLQFRRGRFARPGRKAARRFARALRKRGISVPATPRRGRLLPAAPGVSRMALVESPSMADLIAATNTYSDNFLAESLLKAVGAYVRGTGSTRAGLSVVRGFTAERGARVRGENGSGLSIRDKASPRSVATLLRSMLDEKDATRTAWLDSLAIAAETGTLQHRMDGTAAAGRCRGKTGTLARVSVLSGYCFIGSGRVLTFSWLMNGVGNLYRAHAIQDKMTALVARYRP